MEWIRVTKENLEQEHICCAISNNRDIQVMSKKNWMAEQLDEGLTFIKSSERGKCFIEYIPAEKAWVPIEAEGYLYIDCLWVSGSLKGHGYSTELLDFCLEDAKRQGKKGLCILSSKKKRGFLADPKFLLYKGFLAADTSDPGIELWYFPMNPSVEPPRFKECAKHPKVEEKGFVLYYTNQCPFTAKYVPVVETAAEEQGLSLKVIRLDTREKAQNAPCPNTTYALFKDGEYLTNEVLNDKKFAKYC